MQGRIMPALAINEQTCTRCGEIIEEMQTYYRKRAHEHCTLPHPLPSREGSFKAPSPLVKEGLGEGESKNLTDRVGSERRL